MAEQTFNWCMWHSWTKTKLWRTNRRGCYIFSISDRFTRKLELICYNEMFSPELRFCVFQVSFTTTIMNTISDGPTIAHTSKIANPDDFCREINHSVIDEAFDALSKPFRPKPDNERLGISTPKYVATEIHSKELTTRIAKMYRNTSDCKYRKDDKYRTQILQRIKRKSILTEKLRAVWKPFAGILGCLCQT